MRARVVTAVATPLVVLTGYVALDIADVVPGFLTAQGEWVAPAPFVTAAPALVQMPDATAGLGEDAPQPAAPVVQGFAQALRDDSRTGSSTNVSVVDLLTGETLADLDAGDPQVPASTTKVLTTVAAVAQLGPDATFTTSVTWDGATLTLVGGGDALLSSFFRPFNCLLLIRRNTFATAQVSGQVPLRQRVAEIRSFPKPFYSLLGIGRTEGLTGVEEREIVHGRSKVALGCLVIPFLRLHGISFHSIA